MVFTVKGEGPSTGLLRDYEPSCGPSFEALLQNQVQSPAGSQGPTSSPALSRRSFSVMDLREKFSSGVSFQKPRVQREDSFSHIPEDLRQFFRKDRQH